jgi:2-oxoglutarate ferredoxin oxidoreductase subunit alpha
LGFNKERLNGQQISSNHFINEGDLEKHNILLAKKWEAIQKNEQRYLTYKAEDAKILFVSYGSQARICRDAVDNSSARY